MESWGGACQVSWLWDCALWRSGVVVAVLLPLLLRGQQLLLILICRVVLFVLWPLFVLCSAAVVGATPIVVQVGICIAWYATNDLYELA